MNTDILQGSVVTCLNRGGIFKQEFVANLLLSWLVKFFFENRIIVIEVMAKSLVSVFLTYGVHALYHAADRFRCTSVC